LKRTLGGIALTAIDIGAIIGREYPQSLELQRRINTEVPSMALIAVSPMGTFAGSPVMSRDYEKNLAFSTAPGLQPSRRVPAD